MKGRAKEGVLVILMFTITCILYFLFSKLSKQNFKLVFLDVGQGDSIYFESPKGVSFLVDGGRDKIVLNRLNDVKNIFDNRIDFVIATHDDADHVAGLYHVIKKYDVKNFIVGMENSKSEYMIEILKICKEKNIRVIKVHSPKIIKTEDGLIVKILFPVKDMNDIADSNSGSIVAQIIFGKTKTLLTGDLGSSGEEYLASTYGNSLESQILKLGHHGSDTSTSPNFLSKVKSKVAIVSAGRNNNFGHPSRSVVELVEKFESKILETSVMGNIKFESDGINIWLSI